MCEKNSHRGGPKTIFFIAGEAAHLSLPKCLLSWQAKNEKKVESCFFGCICFPDLGDSPANTQTQGDYKHL